MTIERTEMESVNLRKLEYSPIMNPLVENIPTIKTKKHMVRAGVNKSMVDLETGEMAEIAIIHQFKEKDDDNFVKVFSAGISAAYQLTKTAAKVFQAVLNVYEKTPMNGGYAEAVTLYWFDNGLDGESVGMSEKTYQRGLKELIAKGFLAPKVPNQYWVNPALFFKGDRVRFVTEYRRVRISEDQKRRELLEKSGQSRIET